MNFLRLHRFTVNLDHVVMIFDDQGGTAGSPLRIRLRDGSELPILHSLDADALRSWLDQNAITLP